MITNHQIPDYLVLEILHARVHAMCHQETACDGVSPGPKGGVGYLPSKLSSRRDRSRSRSRSSSRCFRRASFAARSASRSRSRVSRLLLLPPREKMLLSRLWRDRADRDEYPPRCDEDSPPFRGDSPRSFVAELPMVRGD
jgi:hypothetical protein